LNSWTANGPRTTDGLRISGLADASLHERPLQTRFGTGVMTFTIPNATGSALGSLSVTWIVRVSGVRYAAISCTRLSCT
jgi:hypothetical protein